MRIAVVTTLVNAESVLHTFLRYHKKIGIDHFFLFFDDVQARGASFVNDSQVTTFNYDALLRKRWETTKAFDQFHPFINREVMARQVLNMEVAIQECLTREIDWLIHIDIDELFYSREGNIRRHFEDMVAQAVTNVSYMNHEAIPEKLEIGDYFSEVSLFKRNVQALPQRDLIENNIVKSTGDRYFLFYSNGKAAARITPSLYPKGIREFHTGTSPIEISDPCILHFPCCGLTHFKKKYQTLKNFGDRWFGKDEIRELIPMHVESRDVIKGNDPNSIEQFYQKNFIERPLQQRDRFLAEELYFRVNLNQYMIC